MGEERVRIVRGIPLNKRFTGEMFDPPEPLIPELAAAARRPAQIPVAGEYGIERFKLPEGFEVPPESMMYEEKVDAFKLDDELPGQFRDYNEILKNLPPELLACKGDKPYVYTPVDKSGVEADLAQQLEDASLGNDPALNEAKDLESQQKAVGEKSKSKKNKSKEKGGVFGLMKSKDKVKDKPTPPSPNPKPRKNSIPK